MRVCPQRRPWREGPRPRGTAVRRPRLAAAAGTSIVRSRLFIKYVALFVAVVSLALVANGTFDVYFSYQEQKASLVRIQREQAEAAAGKIGQFIGEIESQVGWTTQLPWSAGTLEQRRFDALRLLRQVPAITELAEIDSSGHEQLKVSRLAMEVVGSGTGVSKEPSFAEAVAHKVYYGPVYFRRESRPRVRQSADANGPFSGHFYEFAAQTGRVLYALHQIPRPSVRSGCDQWQPLMCAPNPNRKKPSRHS
jgi:two-component system, NtrC family, sensor kinase